MGYRCPVCEAPQADAEHLANHLALTALTHEAEHAVWLEEHAPDWAACGPADLAERVAPLAPETEHEPDPGAAGDHSHDAHGRPPGHDHAGGAGGPADETVERARRAAREMARRHREE